MTKSKIQTLSVNCNLFFRIIDKKLQTRVALPGLQVQYSTDGGVTWNDVRSEMEVDRRIKLKTRLNYLQNRLSNLRSWRNCIGKRLLPIL